MNEKLTQIIYGFHVCDRPIAQKTLASEVVLTPSHNGYDWLGDGIYFWGNAPFRAEQWKQTLEKKPHLSFGKPKDPIVLGAMIAPNECLDLLDLKHVKLLQEAHNEFINLLGTTQEIPKNEKGKNYLDCAVINMANFIHYRSTKKEFDTVRGAFLEGDPIYSNATIRDLTHIQICVRNPASIIGYFLPT